MRRFSITAIFLMLCAVRIGAANRFVSLTSPNSAPPYTNWDTAAHVIQDAIDAADPGDIVIVTNGIYDTGGRVVYETLTNRIAILKPLTVQSVNGPSVTTIEGYQVPATTNGPGAVRCVYMTNNTTLSGFTITHGATDTNPNSEYDVGVGGVWCENFTNSVLSNCVIIANSAFSQCGGVSSGTLYDCVIANNSDSLYVGGAAFSTLNRCLVTNNYSVSGAGGIRGLADQSPQPQTPITYANDCIIARNFSAGDYGGGAREMFLNNCLIIGNQEIGASACKLFNCTVISNSIGIQYSLTENCIVYYNSNRNFDLPNYLYNYQAYLCSTPFPSFGFGNITNEPLFVDPAHGDFHLQPSSPCINSGDNDYLTVTNNFWDTNNFIFTMITNDFDSNPRIAGGTVDMGAYEFQSPASRISYAWLQQNGFPLDGSADSADPDGDGMSNYQEWRSRTLPFDSTSLLLMLPPGISPTGPTLTWQSQTNVSYYAQRATALNAPFSTIQSNIVGQPGITSYIDTNSVGSSSFFYRVGVQ